MSSKIKHPRAAALVVARELTTSLQAVCEPGRFIFAGSLRRRKAEVGDIEVVYVPRWEMQADPEDLLGNPTMTNLVGVILNEWLRAGVISKRVGPRGGTAWGSVNKMAVHTGVGIGLDFFQADKRNFWSLLVCRTGSMESNTRICMAANARGETWDPYAGFRDRLTKELLFVPGSERAVFEHVGLPYQEPWERV